MLTVKYSNQAVKFLKKCDNILTNRILNKIESLASNPFPQDVKVTQGDKLFRVRVGKIRILYEIDFKDNLLGIIKIDKRERIY
ncbi:MAG: type II toxin-antitoxin system RelE/ParE family toxin [Candidatus Woesearchaeota archaeon]